MKVREGKKKSLVGGVFLKLSSALLASEAAPVGGVSIFPPGPERSAARVFPADVTRAVTRPSKRAPPPPPPPPPCPALPAMGESP